MYNNKQKTPSVGGGETEILIHLAENGADIQMRVVEALDKDQSNISKQFSSLKRKDLIAVTEKVQIKHAKYDAYWLTGKGIKYVLQNGADPDLVLEHAKKHYSTNITPISALVKLAKEDTQLLDIFTIMQKGNKIDLDLETLIKGASILLDTEYVQSAHDEVEIEGFKEIMRKAKANL